MTAQAWAALVAKLLLLSLLQVGGALAIAPDLHRVVVDRLALLSDAQFAAAIAIAQASPGPNTLYVALVGYQAAGVVGAAVAQLAILLPSSMLAVAAGRWGTSRGRSRAVRAFRAAMAPITIALLGATSWIIVSQTGGWRVVAAAGASAVAVWRTRLHILWIIAAGALAGALGVV
jgi:chromate transporter